MRSEIHISAPAIGKNYSIFCKLVQPALVSPVIKSNGYGHGFEQIYRILSRLDQPPVMITVNYVDEAANLRQWGYQDQIFVVGPLNQQQMRRAAELQASIVIGDSEAQRMWCQLDHRPAVHIKFDTGMGRQGFLPQQAQGLSLELEPYRSEIIGMASHLANVEDVSDHRYAFHQMEQFQRCLGVFEQAGYSGLKHIGASASALLLLESRFDMVRIGIALYGLWPSQATRLSFLQNHHDLVDLEPALTWLTEIAAIKNIPQDSFIGYGCTYRAVTAMTIAVLPIGYNEGYPRLAGEKGAYVLVGGSRCKIVGRICMNMMMIDITHLSHRQVGDRVTLIGRDHDEVIEAQTLATWAETIHYELVTRIHPDIPRIIRE